MYFSIRTILVFCAIPILTGTARTVLPLIILALFLLAGELLNQPFWASDDAMYVGSGNAIDKIAEDDGENFDPGTSTTYDDNSGKAVLDLPEGEDIGELLELGNYIYAVCDYKIYPWDKVSASF
jgi:hypothetical protein